MQRIGCRPLEVLARLPLDVALQVLVARDLTLVRAQVFERFLARVVVAPHPVVLVFLVATLGAVVAEAAAAIGARACGVFHAGLCFARRALAAALLAPFLRGLLGHAGEDSHLARTVL